MTNFVINSLSFSCILLLKISFMFFSISEVPLYMNTLLFVNNRGKILSLYMIEPHTFPPIVILFWFVWSAILPNSCTVTKGIYEILLF